MVSTKTMCVVGAGVSNLISARELRREGHDVTVMEQSAGVGRKWLYDPGTHAGDPLGVAGVHVSGDSRSYRAQTMKENKSSRTKTKTQDKGQPKSSFLNSRILKR
jgi:monoamine oxidase